jgi:transposase
MKKTYQFRIYPNKNQEVVLNKTLSTCRHLYNDSLGEKRKQATSNTVLRLLQVFPWGKPEWINYEDSQRSIGIKTDFQKKYILRHSKRIEDWIEFQEFLYRFGYPRLCYYV